MGKPFYSRGYSALSGGDDVTVVKPPVLSSAPAYVPSTLAAPEPPPERPASGWKIATFGLGLVLVGTIVVFATRHPLP